MSEREPASDRALRRRLQEAEETLDAIRAGEVDAVVVEGPNGQQVYTLESPDEPFRIFVEQMQEGALTITSDGTIVYCNRFFADLVGRPLEQVRGQSLYSFLDDESGDAFKGLLDAAAAGIAHGECRLRAKHGESAPVQLAFNRLPAEDSNMFGIVVTDLAERERAQRLDAERQAAEQANAARDQFLAVVSHELRTPLNAMLGWTQVLLRRKDVPTPLQYGLEVIERNAWSQAQLIDDLLDVSRVLAGKLRLDLQPLDLHGVVNAAIATVQPLADQKRIAIKSALARGLTVHGDADRLQQVVWNLLSNAVKFTAEGGEVCVSLQERGSCAVIEVTDTGIGIPPSFLPQLFELYHQIEDSTARRSGGLGLGLAIVRQLTELHGGEVRATSKGEGQGATFTVRLPVSAPAPATAGTDPPPAQPIPALTGIRVLIVEDEADGREVLAQLLEGAGAIVPAAVANASEALRTIEREPIDVLVSDLGLPGMDGYELIRRVRAAGRSGKELPAVALTAYVGRKDRQRVLLAGFQAHLSKPVDQDELCAVIASLAGR